MKSLSKTQLADRDARESALHDARQALEAAIADYNEKVTDLWGEVEKAQTDYNNAVDEANEWLSDMKTDMEGYQNERAEKWHESEAGSAYQEWINAYEEELDHVELDAPEPLEVPDLPETPLTDRPEKPE